MLFPEVFHAIERIVGLLENSLQDKNLSSEMVDPLRTKVFRFLIQHVFFKIFVEVLKLVDRRLVAPNYGENNLVDQSNHPSRVILLLVSFRDLIEVVEFHSVDRDDPIFCNKESDLSSEALDGGVFFGRLRIKTSHHQEASVIGLFKLRQMLRAQGILNQKVGEVKVFAQAIEVFRLGFLNVDPAIVFLRQKFFSNHA
jgi:hypothetical protein